VNYKIRTLTDFDKSFKRLSKKYNSLGKDLKELLLKLQENPQLGTSLGNNFFKIRLKITSKSTGKSEESTVSDKSLNDWAKLIE